MIEINGLFTIEEAVPNGNAPIRSYLKWAGSKTRILGHIYDLIPLSATRYIEPFVGSGVVALNLVARFNEMLLSDYCVDLIECHKLAAYDESFVKECKAMFIPENNIQSEYVNLRKEFNTTTDIRRKAVLFLYLNRHCFNGMCRYSATGKYNTSFGAYTEPYFPEDELYTFRQMLGRSEFVAMDFRGMFENVGSGDFIYCDPPYSPLTSTSNFSSYSGTFGEKDHMDLRDLAIMASKNGAKVAISNHDTTQTRELYKDADEIIELQVMRTISGAGDSRGNVAEVIAVYGT
jgi:DNA adenine methylase